MLNEMNNWWVARYIDEDNKIRIVACDDRQKLADHLKTIGVDEYNIAEETFEDLAAEMKTRDE
jgi:hypothetical protein